MTKQEVIDRLCKPEVLENIKAFNKKVDEGTVDYSDITNETDKLIQLLKLDIVITQDELKASGRFVTNIHVGSEDLKDHYRNLKFGLEIYFFDVVFVGRSLDENHTLVMNLPDSRKYLTKYLKRYLSKPNSETKLYTLQDDVFAVKLFKNKHKDTVFSSKDAIRYIKAVKHFTDENRKAYIDIILDRVKNPSKELFKFIRDNYFTRSSKYKVLFNRSNLEYSTDLKPHLLNGNIVDRQHSNYLPIVSNLRYPKCNENDIDSILNIYTVALYQDDIELIKYIETEIFEKQDILLINKAISKLKSSIQGITKTLNTIESIVLNRLSERESNEVEN
jgi:hypothetical protein